jgi:hypothetical protein
MAEGVPYSSSRTSRVSLIAEMSVRALKRRRRRMKYGRPKYYFSGGAKLRKHELCQRKPIGAAGI